MASSYGVTPRNPRRLAELAAKREREIEQHQRTGDRYAYCSLWHPADDAEAREWCRSYHRP